MVSITDTSFDEWDTLTVERQATLRKVINTIVTAYIANTGEGEQLSRFIDEAMGTVRPDFGLTGEQKGMLEQASCNLQNVLGTL